MPTLVIHTGAIGDFLLACPALAALATHSTLDLAGDPARLELAVAANIARAAHHLDAIEFHTAFAEPSDTLKNFLRRYDRVIVWMRDPEHTLHDALKRCGPLHVQIFPGLPDATWAGHAADYYAHCLGLPSLPPLRLDLQPSGPPLDIVLHPGSGSPKKNWPLENFLQLEQSLTSRARHVTWCLGPAEHDRATAATLQRNPAPHTARREILPDLSLVDLARRLSTARLYIGNDSGITHLAAALALPTLALFGPTDPKIWAPQGKNVQVLQAAPFPSLNEVLQVALNPPTP